MEDRTLARRSHDGDVAAALLDDAKDHRQAQTRTPTQLLGGEERLEDVGTGLLVHAQAGVGHAQQDVRTGTQLGLDPWVGRPD